MKFLAFILLLIALVFEVSLTTLPLIFLVLLTLAVVIKENWIFLFAFIFGVLFDLISFKTIGISSAYFIIFIFLVLLYQKKFEISTIYFVLTSSFLGSFGFLLILGYNNSILLQAFVSSLIGVFIFIAFKRFMRLDSNSSKSL
mgnify:FL=1